MTTDLQRLRDKIKTLFPLPNREALLAEAKQGLPFRDFGVSGGYGETRHELVVAIQLEDFEYAERLYHSLIEEGILDQQAERAADTRPEISSTSDPINIAFEMAELITERENTHIGKTYRILQCDEPASVGLTFRVDRILNADEYEVSGEESGAFNMDDLRLQIEMGKIEEVVVGRSQLWPDLKMERLADEQREQFEGLLAELQVPAGYRAKLTDECERISILAFEFALECAAEKVRLGQ